MWCETPLGLLVDIISGGTPSRDVSAYWRGDIPWVTPTDITACPTNYLSATTDYLTKAGFLNSSAKMLPVGSILFTSRATVGLSKIATIPVCTNQGFKSLVPKKEVDNVFLFYQVQRLKGSFERYAAGSTFPEINKKDTARVLILHPTNKQLQKKIATILTSIDTTIEKTEALITKYQQIKSGLMHDLFTRGVLPNGKLRPPREQAPELYQETGIGWIPREWSINVFGSKALIIDPNPSHRYPDETTEGVPICSTENFIGEDDFNFSKSKIVSETAYIRQNSRCQFKHDDIVFARKGKIGLARRYGEQRKVFSHTVVIFRAKSDEIEPNWLLWLSRSNWLLGSITKKMNFNSGVPTLGVDFISKIEIPLPDIIEQQVVAKTLENANIALAKLQHDLKNLYHQKLGLMQDLLTGKVPVKFEEEDKMEPVT